MGDIIFFMRKDKTMLNILDVAKYFLSLGSMKHKKLQKLCYYAQAWYMAITGKRLMDTDFQAWVHGPVSPQLYERYKGWKGIMIPKVTVGVDINAIAPYRGFLDFIYDIYKNYTADDLEMLTHSESPWEEARKGYMPDEICRKIISDESMKNFYRELLNNGVIDGSDT